MAAVSGSTPVVRVNGQTVNPMDVYLSNIEWHSDGMSDPTAGYGFHGYFTLELGPGEYVIESQWLHDYKACTLTVTE